MSMRDGNDPIRSTEKKKKEIFKDENHEELFLSNEKKNSFGSN
jgi:hypothetical protein